MYVLEPGLHGVTPLNVPFASAHQDQPRPDTAQPLVGLLFLGISSSPLKLSVLKTPGAFSALLMCHGIK